MALTFSIRNLYSTRGLLLRLAFDIFVANLGMLVGTIFSVALAIMRFPFISQDYFREMFVEKWVFCIPILSLSCFVCFPLSGLYGIDLRGKYREDYCPPHEGAGWGGGHERVIDLQPRLDDSPQSDGHRLALHRSSAVRWAAGEKLFREALSVVAGRFSRASIRAH